MLRMTLAALLFAASLFVPATATAQDPAPVAPPGPIEERIAPFVVDVRIALPRFKSAASVAQSLGVTEDDLPGRGLGLVVGAHVYPVRGRSVALGLGGEVLLRARGSNTVPPAVEGGADGPTVVTRMSAVSPQVSLNFGRRDGYSYLSGGIGWGSFTTELEDNPVGDAESNPRVITYGAGARWFTAKHLAVSLDLRFYKMNAQELSVDRPAYPASTMMMFSAGISTR